MPRAPLPLPHLLVSQAAVDDDLKLLGLSDHASGVVTLRLRPRRNPLHRDVLQQLQPTQRLRAPTPGEIRRACANRQLRVAEFEFGVTHEPDTAEVIWFFEHACILA